MDILITSLALSVGEMFDNTEIMIEMESRGRNNIVEGVDLSRIVG
jgi:hypothetical protein